MEQIHAGNKQNLVYDNLEHETLITEYDNVTKVKKGIYKNKNKERWWQGKNRYKET